jgi:hypothetical protein
MQNPAIIWTAAAALAAACFSRGLVMRSGSNPFGELLWYTAGTFLLAGTAILWVSLEREMYTQQRIVLGVLGAIFGAVTLMTVGEFVKPTQSSAQNALPVDQQIRPPPPCPKITVSGGQMVGNKTGVDLEGCADLSVSGTKMDNNGTAIKQGQPQQQ